MRRTLSILVENRPGELSRVLGVFTARGQLIESLSVAKALDPGLLRITLVTTAQEQALQQIVKRIDRQVRVLEVADLTAHASAERELALVRLEADLGPELLEVLKLVVANHLRLIEANSGYLTLESTGDWKTVQEIVARVNALGASTVRSGAVAVTAAQDGQPPAQRGGQRSPDRIHTKPVKEKKCEATTIVTRI